MKFITSVLKSISIKKLIDKIKFYYFFKDKIKFITKSNTAENKTMF